MLLVKFLRREFQWLIISSDEHPILDGEGLEKFILHGYDPELGWRRKPGTWHDEQGKYGTTRYHIDMDGARCRPGHEHFPVYAVCYGDSFTFCRQVNDNETWEYFLSEKLRAGVLNFGVGNYGLDQALLRMERELNSQSPRIVIMGVVPSTIVRILCVWKHYNEFGNTFGFKPRFDLKDSRLIYIKNIIDHESKFPEYEKYLDRIKVNDYFYESKFRREMIRFPYLFHIWKNAFRNIPLISILLIGKLFKVAGIRNHWLEDYPLMKIMQINLKLRYRLFKDRYACDLFLGIIERFREFVLARGMRPVFLFLPQKDDVLFIKKRGYYYRDLIRSVGEKLVTVDMTDILLAADDLDTLYSDDNVYGGHFSKDGNCFVAEELYKKLKENNLLE